MRKPTRGRTLTTSTLILLIAASVLSGAQNTTSPTPTRPPVNTSPEILPDHRVVFRVLAPTASQVEVSTAEIGRLPMQKDAAGIWSATTEPLGPDIYLCRITIEGRTTNRLTTEWRPTWDIALNAG